MLRFTMLAVAILPLAVASAARGQDTDEVKKLKGRIELLENKLKLAEKEVELLKKELEQTKKGGVKAPTDKPKDVQTLADLLTEGTVIRGDFSFRGKKVTGDWSLTIKEVTGKKFKGLYNVREVEGTIDGDRISFKSVNTTVNISVIGSLKKDTIDLVWTGPEGIADLKAKAPK